MTRNDTLAVVTGMLREVIGEDWDLEQPITTDTSLANDRELESTEFVGLAEKLREKYGTDVDFVPWLSSEELDEIIGLKVGA